MSDVNETLQELVERRLREMGQRRGRGENLSLREAWLRLPEGPNGVRAVSYETVRRIRELGHSKIGDATADALATMLEVSVDEVLEAAGQRKRLGPFRLPRRAERLTESERAAVLGVVDAILDAGEKAHSTKEPHHGSGKTAPATRLARRRSEVGELQKKAARNDPS